MAKIAVMIGDMFEDVEYIKPARAFSDAGHQLVHVGVSAGQKVKGKAQGTEETVDAAAKDVSVDAFDAMFIPGGYSPDHLRTDPAVLAFVRDFVNSGKPVLSICHAPQLLVSAQVLKGRKIAGWPSIAQDVKNAGAEFVDREVVEDGNIVSSRRPSDIPAFVETALRRLSGIAAKQPAGAR